MNSTKVKTLAEGAIMIALATVLSFIKVYQLPWGGSITLLSMLPIVVFSIKHGAKKGLAISFVYSLIQLGQGILVEGLLGWGLNAVMLVSCIFCDYILAYGILGFAGIFRKKGLVGWIAGTSVAVVLRFACHFASGVFIWASCGKLWEGFYTENVWIYSMLYNGSYMLPELIFTIIGAVALFTVPQTRKLIASES